MAPALPWNFSLDAIPLGGIKLNCSFSACHYFLFAAFVCCAILAIRIRSSFIHDLRRQYPPIEPLVDFSMQDAEPMRLRPFKPKFYLTMAVEKTTISNLIQIDRNYFDRIKLRKRILSEKPSAARQATPAALPAVQELYTLLVNLLLPTRFPTLFRLDRSSRVLRNLVSGGKYPLAPPKCPLATLNSIGTLVDEDWMILLPEKDGKGYRLQAYVVCFSSGFAMQKIYQKKLTDIHGAVPRFKEKLQLSMERWFDRLESGMFYRRANWTITMHGRMRNEQGENQLYEEKAEQNSAADAGTDVDLTNAHFRSELQHIFRLPRTRAIVFAYKTYLVPLKEIKEEGSAEALAAAIEGFSKGNVPEIARYKRGTVWGPPVCEYLRS